MILSNFHTEKILSRVPDINNDQNHVPFITTEKAKTFLLTDLRDINVIYWFY